MKKAVFPGLVSLDNFLNNITITGSKEKAPENSELHLSCQAGEVINVIDAIYGSQEESPPCLSDNSLSFVTERFVEKSRD